MNTIRSMCQRYLPDLNLPPYNLSPLGGSDDFSYFMERVQASSPHNDAFDFDEKVLALGPRIFASLIYYLSHENKA